MQNQHIGNGCCELLLCHAHLLRYVYQANLVLPRFILPSKDMGLNLNCEVISPPEAWGENAVLMHYYWLCLDGHGILEGCIFSVYLRQIRGHRKYEEELKLS